MDKGAIPQQPEVPVAPLKCYWTYRTDMEHQDIVFAVKRSAAIAASDAYAWGGEWTECRAVRMPEFDQYAETGIPKSAMLEKGWWFECYGYNERGSRCCKRLTEDDKPLTIGTEIYCNDDCRRRSQERNQPNEQ